MIWGETPLFLETPAYSKVFVVSVYHGLPFLLFFYFFFKTSEEVGLIAGTPAVKVEKSATPKR